MGKMNDFVLVCINYYSLKFKLSIYSLNLSELHDKTPAAAGVFKIDRDEKTNWQLDFA